MPSASSPATRVRVPAVPSFAIGRARLLEQLENGTRGRLTTVVAPGGYGKTVLLAQWVVYQPTRRVVWVSLSDRGSDAIWFGRSLVAALAAAHSTIEIGVVDYLDPWGEQLGAAFVDALLGELHGLPATVVVFDDTHLVENAALMNDVSELVDHAPPQFHFVFAGRIDPELPLHRFRSRGELTELRATDLAFSPDELGSVVESLSYQPLSGPQRDLLMTRTEGWPVGVQLAAVRLHAADDAEAFLERFAGDDENVADFLSAEVLRAQPDDVRRFMLETSVLERMSADVCNAITGRSDSGRVLESLDRRSLFITRADNAREWFRYHPLLRDLLQYYLAAEAPDRGRELRRAAAQWYLEQDDVLTAGEYLVDAAAWSDLIKLIHEQSRWLWEAGESTTALRWLRSIPESSHRHDPLVALLTAGLELTVGSYAAAQDTIVHLESQGAFDEGTAIAASMLLGSATDVGGDPVDALERSEKSFAQLATKSDDFMLPAILGFDSLAAVRMTLAFTASRAHFYLGNLDDALVMADLAYAEEPAQRPLWVLHLASIRALPQATRGWCTAAHATATYALQLAREHGAAPAQATIGSQLALAMVARERNDLAAASHLIEEAMARARQYRRPWFLALLIAEQGLLSLARGVPEDGVHVIESFRHEPQPPAPRYVESRVDAAYARLLTALGQPKRALAILDRYDPDATTPEVAAARIGAAFGERDTALAQKTLETWPADNGPRARVQFESWTAVLEFANGERAAAARRVESITPVAEQEGLARAFLDNGPEVMRVVRAAYERSPSSYLLRLAETPVVTPAPARIQGLAEQLSERELAVVRYLPSRLSNAEIAEHMYVSINTLKTHLKSIYRKLDVTTRREAILRSEELGLLRTRNGPDVAVRAA